MLKLITLRKMICSLLVGVGLLLSGQAHASGCTAQLEVVVCSGGQRAALDLNFATLPSLPSYATFTRTSAAWDFNSQGILTQFASGVPRFPVYDPATLANLGIRIEQAHTNSILTSAGGFSNASFWAPTNSSATDSNVNSPGGTNTGSTFADNSTSGAHFIASNTISFTSGTTYTFSIVAKAGTGNLIQLAFPTASGVFTSSYINFDLSAGTSTANGGSLVASGIIPLGNGWYRCWAAMTAAATASSTVFAVRINSSTATRAPSYVGTGTTIIIWQADVIAASLPLSPIPTSGTAVTVNAETLSIPLSSIGIPANPSGLTVLAKARTAGGWGPGNQTIFSVNDGTTSNRMHIAQNGATSLLAAFEPQGSLNTFALGSGFSANQDEKVWFAASTNNLSVQAIGGTKQTSAALPMVTGLTTLNIGAAQAASAPWNSTISRFVIYNSRLSDAVAAQKAGGL
jgi:hypothetical protein